MNLGAKNLLVVTEDENGVVEVTQQGGVLWAMGAAEAAQRLLTLQLFNEQKKRQDTKAVKPEDELALAVGDEPKPEERT